MVNTIAIIMIAVAIYLLIVSGRVMALMGKTNTADSAVMRATQGIYTIGVILLTVGATLLVLKYSENQNHAVVQIVVGVFALTTLVLSAIVVNKAVGEARNWAISLLVASILLLLGVAGMAYWEKKTGNPINLFEFEEDDTDFDTDTDTDTDDDNFSFACY
jgi:hypothetical protein